MEFIMALFNIWAFGALIVIAVISGLLYAKTASARERLGLMGSFAQSAALAVSGLLAVMVVTSPEIAMDEVGPMVRLVVTITLYGVLFNLACKIWARLLREGPDAPSA